MRSFFTVTTLTARSTSRLSRHDLVPLPRSARSQVSAPTCVLGAEKGGESSMFKSLVALKREDGQTMAEYGVVLAVIALAVVVALAALSGAISAAINEVTSFL